VSARRGKKPAPAPATETRTRLEVEVPEGLYQRIKREVAREKFITPYMLAERYNMTITLAKRVLRRLVKEGVLRVYAYNRRAPIYVPAGS